MRGVSITAAAAALAFLIAGTSSTAGKTKPPFPISKPRWLAGVQITEYYPAPERWFVGRRVKAPGLTGRHRVDWLYSHTGVAMEGDGLGLDGRHYHISAVGTQGWVTEDGRPTAPGPDGWSGGGPFWRAGGWRNKAGAVTFPLELGGWYKKRGVRYIKPRGIRFSPGQSQPLRPWRSIAIDPGVISYGSRVFIPAFCDLIGHAWFKAEDHGGAIIGRHIDVYRNPPKKANAYREVPVQRVFVIPPNTVAPANRPTCATYVPPS